MPAKYKVGQEVNGRVVTGVNTVGYDKATGRNLAWEQLSTGEKKRLLSQYSQRGEGSDRPSWMTGMDTGDRKTRQLLKKIRSQYKDDIAGASSTKGGDVREGQSEALSVLIAKYKGETYDWADIPEVPVVEEAVQETPEVSQPDPDIPEDYESGTGGEELGNPPNAPPDEGLHAINDWLMPGELDTTMLQAFDLFDIGEGGYTLQEIEDYNAQATEWNTWIQENPDAATEQGMEAYELYDFQPVSSPRTSEWENLMADKIQEAKVDEVVTQEEVSNIFANAIYMPPEETASLTSWLDEQNERELKKKAREKEGYLSMNRTFGLDLGDYSTYYAGLY